MAMNKPTRRKQYARRKVCRFCAEKTPINYKDVDMLSHYITDRAKIVPRRITGTCARHQRELSIAIKRARYIALMPFSPPGHDDFRG